MPRYRIRSAYQPHNAWFVCDRCSQRRRRSSLRTEWTGLKVCPTCEDPRPPQMTPPDVYPEGLPFPDAREPQDNPDLLTDDSTLHPGIGAMGVDTGGLFTLPNGQAQPAGAISPQTMVENPLPQGQVVAAGQVLEDVAIRTGPVQARSVTDPTTQWPAVPPTANG